MIANVTEDEKTIAGWVASLNNTLMDYQVTPLLGRLFGRSQQSIDIYAARIFADDGGSECEHQPQVLVKAVLKYLCSERCRGWSQE